MKIKNKEQLDNWMAGCMSRDEDVYAIKGFPPVGACYEDGEFITNDVNIGWVSSSGDKFYIEYE